MLNAPDIKELSNLPRLYETLDVPFLEKVVHMHFSTEGSEWLVVEYDPQEDLFFGYIDVRPGAPRWGCFGLVELEDINNPHVNTPASGQIERDEEWRPKKVKEISGIFGGEGRGW